jgi:atypical dual specificity phosphatase
MIENFGFVLGQRLAGSAHPGRGPGLREALEEWTAQHGITAVVTLTDEPLAEGLLQEYGLRALHLPVPDFTAPATAQVAQAVRFVHEEIARRGRVVVHCGAGFGRTGCVLACCLVSEQGLTAEAAMEAVRQLRPGSIETDEQEALVRGWALREGRRPRGVDKT